ncbi:hypothetical protein [Planomonospora venezuelensis]|uniref:Uncharacterized protein n=1 Tax=Planomonospora venezuelensis TaxID=1999 RepID=A0A841D8D1_PLAVE|nr:hypothetical protein [Planomonospora venezuelensis]MBB5964578.1 hypothetical protein [Planomonospora venezuelensis]GIN02876.1 hypothetical protein Pve01_45340 [Planomonospora venezuelensis]
MLAAAGAAGLGLLLSTNTAPDAAPFVPAGTAVPDGESSSPGRHAPGGASWDSPVPVPAASAPTGGSAPEDSGGPGPAREPLAPALAPGPLPRTTPPVLPHARPAPGGPGGSAAKRRPAPPSRTPEPATGGSAQARQAPAPRPRPTPAPAPRSPEARPPAARTPEAHPAAPPVPVPRRPAHLPDPCTTFDELRRAYCHAVLEELFPR